MFSLYNVNEEREREIFIIFCWQDWIFLVYRKKKKYYARMLLFSKPIKIERRGKKTTLKLNLLNPNVNDIWWWSYSSNWKYLTCWTTNEIIHSFELWICSLNRSSKEKRTCTNSTYHEIPKKSKYRGRKRD